MMPNSDNIQSEVAKEQDPQVANSNIPETQAETQTAEAQPQTSENPDWHAFREARKRDREIRKQAEEKAAEKEREAAALKAALDAMLTTQGGPSTHAYQQYYGMDQAPFGQQEESEEQKLERKVNELLAKKEEQYRREQAENEKREYPKRLMKDMPDFQQVCSQENLDYLDFHFPEVSRPLQRLEEGYDKWYDTYHAVKKLIPNHANAKKEAIRADVNANKPRSMSTIAPSPTGERSRETWKEIEARRAQRYAEMQKSLKSV